MRASGGGSGGGGSGKGVGAGGVEDSWAVKAFNNGDYSPEVIQALLDMGFTQADIDDAIRKAKGGAAGAGAGQSALPAWYYSPARESFQDYISRLNANTNANTNTSTFKDKDTAAAYLKSKGVKNDVIAGLVTATEWARTRNSYLTTGQGGAIAKYKSYQEYLSAFVKYALS